MPVELCNAIATREATMNFWQMSDGIRPHFQPHHHDEYDGHSGRGAASLYPSLKSVIDTGDNSAGDGGRGSFFGAEVHAPVAIFNPLDAARAGFHGKADAHQSNMVHLDQHAVQIAGMGGNGGNDNTAAGGKVSALYSGSGPANGSLDSNMIQSGANQAGNGGDGYFYGGIIHASFILYQPIDIAVAVGYGSSADAEQTNNVSFNQSAVQIAGVGGNGGNGNTASGGNVGSSSSGAVMIATGGNGAGNGGDGHFFGTLLDAPVVIYHPINIAMAGAGGTAAATQSNTVEIDQSTIQIAGVGGNGGNGNAASGGDVSMLGHTSGSSNGGIDSELIHTGGNQAGNGGDGFSYGGLVHASFALYNPVNIAVAGYNSSAHAYQANNVHLDQSAFQMAGVGGNGGNGNAVTGGNVFSGFGGGSDAIATGHNGAGNGGSGHFSGNIIDVSVAIYAPINIAIAGPNSTADADQINNVMFDQSAVQIAGIGGHGGHGNLALGGDVAMHLLSDLHLIG
jgi:hypothetical protein